LDFGFSIVNRLVGEECTGVQNLSASRPASDLHYNSSDSKICLILLGPSGPARYCLAFRQTSPSVGKGLVLPESTTIFYEFLHYRM